MPFKSKAQVRKFAVLLREGQITQEQHDKWHAETKNIKRLPERLKPKKKKGFAKGFEKIAVNLPEQAAIEASFSMEDKVPGSELRNNAETGQNKGGGRSQYSGKEYRAATRTKYDTSRGGRRYGYN